MTNEERYNEACDRVDCRNGGRRMSHKEIIVDLEMEIERYRDKIMHMENHIEELKTRLNGIYGTSQHEAVREVAPSEIIKALADNGYNTITINCYKTERED